MRIGIMSLLLGLQRLSGVTLSPLIITTPPAVPWSMSASWPVSWRSWKCPS
jgi:hypothetical protein